MAQYETVRKTNQEIDMDINNYLHDPEVTRISSLRNAALNIKREFAAHIASYLERSNKAETPALAEYLAYHVSVGSMVEKHIQTLIDDYTKQLDELCPEPDNWDNLRELLN